MKERIQKEEDIELAEIVRSSDLAGYEEDYDIMVYSASVSCAGVEQYIQDNVVTALLMIKFCKEHNVKRIIYLSSDSIYGEINTDVISEKAIMVSPGTYGVTKYLAEKVIEESGIPYYILRLPGIVGRVWRKNFIYNLISEIKNNNDIALYNIDRKFNNLLDIDDLINFIICLCNNVSKDGKSEIFLLGNTKQVVLKEIVSYVKSFFQSTSVISNTDTNEKRYFTLDVTKAVEYGYSSKNIMTIIGELCQMKRSYDLK